MKIGDKILIPNYIAFENKSDAIAAAVVNSINEKMIEEMDGIYPNEFDIDEDNWKGDRDYEIKDIEIKDIFTLDGITIVQILSNERLLWVWKYDCDTTGGIVAQTCLAYMNNREVDLFVMYDSKLGFNPCN
jgi:hypothetical protein